MPDGMTIRLAEHVEEAMREDGTMPRWKVEDIAPTPWPIETLATLRLSEDLTLHVRKTDVGIWGHITIRGLLRDTDLDAVLSKLPGKLAPQFEAAARELRRIESRTPREDRAEEGGGQ